MAYIGQNISWADFVEAVRERTILLFARNGTAVDLLKLQSSLRSERNIYAEIDELNAALVQLLKNPDFGNKFKLVYLAFDKGKDIKSGSSFSLVYDSGVPAP